MSIKKIMMPVDYTGELASNRVAGEVHELEGSLNKLLVPYNGFFYTNNMRLYDDKHQLLTREEDYECIYANPEVQMRTPGLEVCGAIIIKPHIKTNTASLSCNYVGGSWANYTKAIEEALIALDLDKRSIDFASLIGMPEYFTAGAHIEDIGNVYGFEYLITAINRIKDTMSLNHSAESEQVADLLDGVITAINTMFDKHKDDPKAHGTTAADVGAYDKTEVDHIAQQLSNAIDIISATVNEVVGGQGDMGSQVTTMNSKLRTMHRRMTIIDNIAKNALRRIAAYDSGPSESDELTLKSLIVKTTLNVLGAITSPNGVFDNLTVKNQLLGNFISAANVTVTDTINANIINANSATLTGNLNALDIFARNVTASQKVSAQMIEATNGSIGNNLNVGGNSNITYDLSVGRAVTAETLYTRGIIDVFDLNLRSDARFKDSVEELNNCLERIMAFRPVEYDKAFKIGGKDFIREIGLIADEVMANEPLLVSENRGIKGVRIYGILSLLIGAVQELNRKRG